MFCVYFHQHAFHANFNSDVMILCFLTDILLLRELRRLVQKITLKSIMHVGRDYTGPKNLRDEQVTTTIKQTTQQQQKTDKKMVIGIPCNFAIICQCSWSIVRT